MVSVTEAAVMAAMLFVGSTVLSTVGFGIGLSTTPVLLFVFEPQTVVVVLNTVSAGLFVLIIVQNRRQLPFREVAPLAVAGLAGVPVGVLVLEAASPSVLRIGITSLVIVLTLVTTINVRARGFPRGIAFGVGFGFVASVLINATGIGGPLIALYVISRGWHRNSVRAGLSLYFLVIEVSGVVGYGVAGLLTGERIALVGIAAGPVVMGFMLATFMVRRMNETMFRRAVLTMILVTISMMLARELASV
jgi:uncharacterized membrane protein YfcA